MFVIFNHESRILLSSRHQHLKYICIDAQASTGTQLNVFLTSTFDVFKLFVYGRGHCFILVILCDIFENGDGESLITHFPISRAD